MRVLTVNGAPHPVDVSDDTPLLWVLRDVIGLTGTKFGCGIAQCGACTVHVGGQPVRSCIMPISAVGARPVTTVEALGQTPSGQRIQDAWLIMDVVQCGYCQSGQVMSAAALLERNPNPTDTDIDIAMAGNICRCGTYPRIREAIKVAARGPTHVVPINPNPGPAVQGEPSPGGAAAATQAQAQQPEGGQTQANRP